MCWRKYRDAITIPNSVPEQQLFKEKNLHHIQILSTAITKISIKLLKCHWRNKMFDLTAWGKQILTDDGNHDDHNFSLHHPLPLIYIKWYYFARRCDFLEAICTTTAENRFTYHVSVIVKHNLRAFQATIFTKIVFRAITSTHKKEKEKRYNMESPQELVTLWWYFNRKIYKIAWPHCFTGSSWQIFSPL